MQVAWDALVVVGTIARPHGLRGEVVVNPDTDFPAERFAVGNVVHASPGGRLRALQIRSARFHRGRPIVGFDGVESIEDAEALGRGELRIEAPSVTERPPGTFFHHELVACRVETTAGRAIGLVSEVQRGGGASVLVVKDGAREYLIPLASDICVEIDPTGRRIVVEPPEGLLDLNA